MELTDNIKQLKVLSHYLEELESELAVFFSISIDMILISHSDGRIIKANPAWNSWLGWDKEDLIDHNFFDFVHPDDISATEEVASQLCLTPLVKSFKNRYICKDGTYKTLNWRANCLNNKFYATARIVE